MILIFEGTTLTTTGGKSDLFGFLCTSGNYYDGFLDTFDYKVTGYHLSFLHKLADLPGLLRIGLELIPEDGANRIVNESEMLFEQFTVSSFA